MPLNTLKQTARLEESLCILTTTMHCILFTISLILRVKLFIYIFTKIFCVINLIQKAYIHNIYNTSVQFAYEFNAVDYVQT